MKKWLVLTVAMMSLAASAHNDRDRDRECNRRRQRCEQKERQLKNRTAEEVLEQHRIALATGNWDDALCNYAEDAVVVSDQGITRGRDNIVEDLQAIGGLFGGLIPQVNEEVIVSILNDRAEMGRVLFSISTPCIDIPDGADTYIIKNGRIQAQTAHGFPVFKCGPPPAP